MRARLFAVVSMVLFVVVSALTPSGFTDTPRARAAPMIGEDSCQGVDACIILGDDVVIGDNSCNGPESCVIVENGAIIGDNSCNGEDSCVIVDREASIGHGSCNSEDSCVIVDRERAIGNGSCNGFGSCVIVDLGGSIGDGSCNATGSCIIVDGEVGNNSCQGIETCIIVDQGGSVGDNSCFIPGSCVIVSGDIGDCVENPGCSIELTKIATPETAAASGGTVVAYRIRVQILEDVFVNSIVDSEYPLDVDGQCDVTGGNGQDMPGLFPAGSSIVCDYAYPLPPGAERTTYDNVVTVNVGEECSIFVPMAMATGVEALVHQRIPDREDLPEDLLGLEVNVQAEPCAIAGGAGDVTASAITPGELPGTVDVTAEASVLYVAQDRRPPNIGTGLSGLFNGMPTPLPTAPGAVAPAATAPTISPPRTGDAGLAGGDDTTSVVLGLLIVVSAGIAFGFRLRSIR